MDGTNEVIEGVVLEVVTPNLDRFGVKSNLLVLVQSSKMCSINI